MNIAQFLRTGTAGVAATPMTPPAQAPNPFDEFDNDPIEPVQPVQTVRSQQTQPQQQQQQAPVDPFGDKWLRTVTPGAATDVPADKLEAKNPGWIAFNKKLNEMVNGDATDDEIRAFIAANPQFTATGVDEALAYRAEHRNREVPVTLNTDALPDDLYGKDQGTVDAVGMGAADALAIGAAEEIDAFGEATGQAIKGVFGGGNGKSWSENYDQRYAENVGAMEAADYYHPIATNVGRVAGSVVLPSAGVVRGGGMAINAARLSAEGAAYGAVYGFNADGTLSERAINAMKGGLLGGTVGAVVGGTLGRGAGKVEANRAVGGSEGAQVLAAAERLNGAAARGEAILPLPGHVGGKVTQTVHNIQEPGIIGGLLSGLAGKSEAFQKNVGKALDRVAGDVTGNPVLSLSEAAARAADPKIKGSMAHYMDNFEATTAGPYRQAEALAGGVRVTTPKTVAKLDEILKRMRKVPGGVAGIGDLQELRTALARGQHDLQGLRDLRTSFGDKLDVNNRTARTSAKQLWGVLSEDIADGLKAAGQRDAALAYRKADKFYAKNRVHLENIQSIIGKGNDTDLTIAGRLARMDKDMTLRIQDAMQALPHEVRAEIQGAIIHNLGKKNPGQVTGDGDFSIGNFATNWNKMTEQARHAIAPLPAHRKDLDAIATLANADKRLHRTGDNPSGSAKMLQNSADVAAVATGAVSWPGVLSRWGLGVLLAQPLVAKAMVKIGNSGVSEASLKMLTRAARLSPAYAPQIIGLRDELAGITTGEASAASPTVEEPTVEGTVEANPFDQFDE